VTGAAERAGPAWARVGQPGDLPAALDALGVHIGRPVLLLVGGAGGMTHEDLALAARALEPLVPDLDRWGATVVDGGTDSGVMRVMGAARSAAGARFPLIGVAAEGTVDLRGTHAAGGVPTPGSPPGPAAPPASGAPPETDRAALDQGHTHVILVPGQDWGDESPWLSGAAAVIAGGHPSLVLVVNGGAITYDDIAHSVRAGRPALVLDGTGRTADAIAAAARGQDGGDPRAARAAASPGLRTAPAADPAAVRAAIGQVLAPAGR
jgi:SLOG in TRPM, prokaryote